MKKLSSFLFGIIFLGCSAAYGATNSIDTDQILGLFTAAQRGAESAAREARTAKLQAESAAAQVNTTVQNAAAQVRRDFEGHVRTINDSFNRQFNNVQANLARSYEERAARLGDENRIQGERHLQQFRDAEARFLREKEELERNLIRDKEESERRLQQERLEYIAEEEERRRNEMEATERKRNELADQFLEQEIERKKREVSHVELGIIQEAARLLRQRVLKGRMSAEEVEGLFAQGNISEIIRAAERARDDERYEQRDLYRTHAELLADKLSAEKGRISTEKLRLKEELHRQKWNNIKELFNNTGAGFMNLLGDKQRLANLTLTLAGVMGGYFLLRNGTKLAFTQLERYLNKPNLVQQTSVRGLGGLVQDWFKSPRKQVKMDDIIVSPQLRSQLDAVAESVLQARKFGVELPNVCLYGPPGTGKTMFIEALASATNMTFAKMTGGDVSQLVNSGGENRAVTEIHKLMNWLEANGPAVLFIDEADAFLGKGRDGGVMSEGLKAAINAFLNRTGSSSSKVMVVIATNYPGAIDEAFRSRISKWIYVGNPGLNERKTLLKDRLHQLTQESLKDGNKSKYRLVGVTDDVIHNIATRTEGYSGRDISMKLIDGIKRAALRQGSLEITPDLINSVIISNEQEGKMLSSFVNGDVRVNLLPKYAL